MAITIILICLALQRCLPSNHYENKQIWLVRYFTWMNERFNGFSEWPVYGVVIFLIGLPLIGYLLLAGLIYGLLGMIAYYLLSLTVLWYVLDTRSLQGEKITHNSAQQLLNDAYEGVFAPIFWLLILGSSGVILYALTIGLSRYWQQSSPALKILGILDWLPLRFLGFTFALVGHFSPAFTEWSKNFFVNIESGRAQMIRCGLIAANTEHFSLELMGLINRSLWVWLVVIALFTIGRWVG